MRREKIRGQIKTRDNYKNLQTFFIKKNKITTKAKIHYKKKKRIVQ